MKLTYEQNLIINALPGLKTCMKINAFAGTGKTSTLVQLAEAYPECKFLYLAFNKAVSDEAKKRFPMNTVVKTIHALAYSFVVKRGEKVRGEYGIMEIAKMFSLSFPVAQLVSVFFNSYCNSSLITMKDLRIYLESFGEKTPDIVFNHAYKLYENMIRREIDITHNFYFKEFQRRLNKLKTTDFDYVLLDEGQDSNEATLDIFLKLPGKKIIVGDTHQQIYAFRGSVDAMQRINADKSLYLTETFRCRPGIVNMANYVLAKYKGEPRKLKAVFDSFNDVETIAYIARTNASLIDYIDKFDEFILTREASEIFKSALSVFYFLQLEYDKIYPEYKYLTSFKKSDLERYINETGDLELGKALEQATKYSSDLIRLFEKAKGQKNSDAVITLTTAHSSKGLEFDAVFLSDDFPSLEQLSYDENLTQLEKENEYNLFYVAITRARYVISNNSPNLLPSQEKFNIQSIESFMEENENEINRKGY